MIWQFCLIFLKIFCSLLQVHFRQAGEGSILIYHHGKLHSLVFVGYRWFSGVQRRYLKCSIRGTNNQLPNVFYKSAHLQLCNIKHKIVHLQVFKLFDVKFLFSENHIFQKQKRTTCLWSYGRASLVSDFKFTRKNENCSSRHK